MSQDEAVIVDGSVMGDESLAKDFQFEDADIVLVSSDEVRFKVHKYKLQAFSPVFRAMIRTCGSEAEINFSDSDIEAAQTIKLVLEFACKATFGMFPAFNWETAYENLVGYIKGVKFMQKYDMSLLLNHLQDKVGVAALDEPEYPESLFVLAAVLGRSDAYIDLLAHAERRTPRSGQEFLNAYVFVDQAEVLDIAMWSYKWFALVPPPYAHALMRALGARRTKMPMDAMLWKGVAEDFLVLINQY